MSDLHGRFFWPSGSVYVAKTDSGRWLASMNGVTKMEATALRAVNRIRDHFGLKGQIRSNPKRFLNYTQRRALAAKTNKNVVMAELAATP